MCDLRRWERRHIVNKLISLLSLAILVTVVVSGCTKPQPLPFANVDVYIECFSEDRPTSSSVMRVGNRIEETVEVPRAKLEDVEKAVNRLKKRGWRQLQTNMEVNAWSFILEKDGTQVQFLYRAGRGAVVIASRQASQTKDK